MYKCRAPSPPATCAGRRAARPGAAARSRFPGACERRQQAKRCATMNPTRNQAHTYSCSAHQAWRCSTTAVV